MEATVLGRLPPCWIGLDLIPVEERGKFQVQCRGFPPAMKHSLRGDVRRWERQSDLYLGYGLEKMCAD